MYPKTFSPCFRLELYIKKKSEQPLGNSEKKKNKQKRNANFLGFFSTDSNSAAVQTEIKKKTNGRKRNG